MKGGAWGCVGREGEEGANWAWSGKKEREMGERWGWTVLLGRETEENEGGFSSHAQHVRDLSGKGDVWLMHGQEEMKPRSKRERKEREKEKEEWRLGWLARSNAGLVLFSFCLLLFFGLSSLGPNLWDFIHFSFNFPIPTK